ncbi:MAG TPA: hypothetical protein VFO34_04435 [Candidatus Acidoferrales bacterium]|nr:hypothetical protein [Candidatus Acidoferrales bacterium]
MVSVNLISILALGFFLGMRHATDPDHVIAVSTIVSRHRRIAQAAWVGILWGVGHTVTILAVGTGIIVFGWVIPTRLGLSMEFSVAVMLVLLGVLNLTGMLQRVKEIAGIRGSRDEHNHSHAHAHGDYVHTHAHAHLPEQHPHAADQTPLTWFDRNLGRIGMYQLARPLIVGLVHGLAGSAAVALLVLATIRDARWAVAYLLVFGIGTIAGMMLITIAMSAPIVYSSGRFARANEMLRIASGAISLAFGLFLVYEIGFGGGLFTSHPHWTPH